MGTQPNRRVWHGTRERTWKKRKKETATSSGFLTTMMYLRGGVSRGHGTHLQCPAYFAAGTKGSSCRGRWLLNILGGSRSRSSSKSNASCNDTVIMYHDPLPLCSHANARYMATTQHHGAKHAYLYPRNDLSEIAKGHVSSSRHLITHLHHPCCTALGWRANKQILLALRERMGLIAPPHKEPATAATRAGFQPRTYTTAGSELQRLLHTGIAHKVLSTVLYLLPPLRVPWVRALPFIGHSRIAIRRAHSLLFHGIQLVLPRIDRRRFHLKECRRDLNHSQEHPCTAPAGNWEGCVVSDLP